MFANRYTALIDACSLAGALKRNLLLSLAEGEFYRVRWSIQILDETQSAIEQILTKKGVNDAADRASRARSSMEDAFEEACVLDYDEFLPSCGGLPDKNDAHVMAAAMKTQASVIVTENLKDFPEQLLSQVNIDVRSTDEFIADTIDLDPGRAVAAIRKMRERFAKPAMTAEALLLAMEAEGLIATADLLRPHVESL